MYFQSRDKDGDHTIRSAITKNTTPHANFRSLSSTEPELLPTQDLHCGNMELHAFWRCDLDLDLMTFIYQHDLYPLKIYLQTKNELSMSRLSKVIILQTDTQTCHRKHYHATSCMVTAPYMKLRFRGASPSMCRCANDKL